MDAGVAGGFMPAHLCGVIVIDGIQLFDALFERVISGFLSGRWRIIYNGFITRGRNDRIKLVINHIGKNAADDGKGGTDWSSIQGRPGNFRPGIDLIAADLPVDMADYRQMLQRVYHIQQVIKTQAVISKRLKFATIINRDYLYTTSVLCLKQFLD